MPFTAFIRRSRRAAAALTAAILLFMSAAGCVAREEPQENTDGRSGISGVSPQPEGGGAAAGEDKEFPIVPSVPTLPTQTEPTSVPEAAPAVPPAEDKPLSAALTPVQKSAYYGLNVLQSMPRAENLVAAYWRLVAGVEACETTILLKDSDLPVTVEEIQTVLAYYRYDYPQHFWINLNAASFPIQVSGDTVLSITLPYTLTGDALSEAKAAFGAAASAMLEGLDADMEEAEQERILHDRLVGGVAYDTSLSKADIYNAYGALVNGTAVCEGYARAMQYLLYQAGIQCLIAVGSSKGETHAWNVVCIDRAYYHLDPTWDDPIHDADFDFISYAYFNLTDEEIRRDHEIDETSHYPLPACTDEAAQYYRSRDLVYTTYSAADVASRIRDAKKRGDTLVRFWVSGDAGAYAQSILDDWDKICREAGIWGSIQLITPSSPEIVFSFKEGGTGF